jgi:hypothetical protein
MLAPPLVEIIQNVEEPSSHGNSKRILNLYSPWQVRGQVEIGIPKNVI